MKTLIIDIETSPNLAHVWSLWNQNVGLAQLRESTRVISFAAKWYGDKKVLFYSDHHDGHEAMIERAHVLLDEADAIVHFNGKSFDMKHLKREFAEAGMLPPSPWRDIDLLLAVKKQFRFPSNKLQYVSTALGLEGKVQHSGHDLWVRCLAGDEKAWAVMRKYNKQDVVLTEKLYDRLLPWIDAHPHRGLFTDGETPVCGNCGSDQLQRRGYAVTLMSTYPRYQCQKCGRWSRGQSRSKAVDVRPVAGN